MLVATGRAVVNVMYHPLKKFAPLATQSHNEFSRRIRLPSHAPSSAYPVLVVNQI
jgi:hypothetical protein